MGIHFCWTQIKSIHTDFFAISVASTFVWKFQKILSSLLSSTNYYFSILIKDMIKVKFHTNLTPMSLSRAPVQWMSLLDRSKSPMLSQPSWSSSFLMFEKCHRLLTGAASSRFCMNWRTDIEPPRTTIRSVGRLESRTNCEEGRSYSVHFWMIEQ